MAALLKQNIAAIVSSTLHSSTQFVNQTHRFIANVSVIYLVSHIEVTTEFRFLECELFIEFLSRKRLPEFLRRVSR
jgi:hypothetical protein